MSTELNIKISIDAPSVLSKVPHALAEAAQRGLIGALHDHFKDVSIEEIVEAMEQTFEDAARAETTQRSMCPYMIRERVTARVNRMTDEEVVQLWTRLKEFMP